MHRQRFLQPFGETSCHRWVPRLQVSLETGQGLPGLLTWAADRPIGTESASGPVTLSEDSSPRFPACAIGTVGRGRRRPTLAAPRSTSLCRHQESPTGPSTSQGHGLTQALQKGREHGLVFRTGFDKPQDMLLPGERNPDGDDHH
jgi:hypothetical protein